MKLFAIIVAAILMAAAIITSAVICTAKLTVWNLAKNDAIAGFNYTQDILNHATADLTRETSIPLSAISNLGPDDIRERETVLRIKQRAFSDVKEERDSAALRLQHVLESKPLFLPLSADEEALLTKILPKPTPAPAKPKQTPTATVAAIPKQSAQFVTLIRDVKITVPYGEVTLPKGLRLEMNSRTSENYIRIVYLNQLHDIPINATDLKP